MSATAITRDLALSGPRPFSGDRDRSVYYAPKLEALRDLFGTTAVSLEPGFLVVHDQRYPIVDDVIVLLPPSKYSAGLVSRLGGAVHADGITAPAFAADIQYTFGAEWTAFPEILPEHEREFHQYFDLVNMATLRNWRICDLGCGIGRWSAFLRGSCREIVLVDFSDAIFIARRNLAAATNALFFMGDLTQLPFRDDFADLVVCLGVLHHLSMPALVAVRALRRCSSRLLIYLYYALDNRPFHFRSLLSLVGGLRLILSRCRSPLIRSAVTWLLTLGIYLPFLSLGRLVEPLGWSRYVPLYETYVGSGIRRIRQDVYDRFFTSIEQRHSRQQIFTLSDAFSNVTISDHSPYWHFLCER